MSRTNAGNRFWVVQIKRLAISFFVVFFFGFFWDYATLEPDRRNGPSAGLWALLLYYGLSIALFVVNSIVNLVYLGIFGGSDMLELVLDDLRRSNLPGPRKDQPKRFDYLIDVADDNDEEASVRVRAGALHAAYQVSIQRSGLFGGLALAKALDEATLRYSAEAPE